MTLVLLPTCTCYPLPLTHPTPTTPFISYCPSVSCRRKSFVLSAVVIECVHVGLSVRYDLKTSVNKYNSALSNLCARLFCLSLACILTHGCIWDDQSCAACLYTERMAWWLVLHVCWMSVSCLLHMRKNHSITLSWNRCTVYIMRTAWCLEIFWIRMFFDLRFLWRSQTIWT